MTARRKDPFAELLKYWRARRKLSQLDLSVAAEVSSRHVSFLETGRSRPSKEMVHQFGQVLDLSMRQRNELLGAAGFDPSYQESSAVELLEGPLAELVATIFECNASFPTMVLDRHYRILAANNATNRLLAGIGIEAPLGLNLMRAMFMPGVSEVILNWQDVAADALRRLHRQVLHSPDDGELVQLFEDIKDQAELSDDWWSSGFDTANQPALPLVIRTIDGSTSRFLATSTTFNAPRNIALDDLVIETWYRATI